MKIISFIKGLSLILLAISLVLSTESDAKEKKDFEDTLISFSYNTNTTVDRALTELISQYELPIAFIVQKEIRNYEFSGDCSNCTIYEALDLILKNTDFGYVLEGDIIVITDDERILERKGTIKGWVYDKNTRKPISGVNVWIEGKNGDATDSSGSFEIHIRTGVYKVHFKHYGYRKTIVRNIRATYGMDTELNIYLHPEIPVLESVEVTAAKPKKRFVKYQSKTWNQIRNFSDRQLQNNRLNRFYPYSNISNIPNTNLTNTGRSNIRAYELSIHRSNNFSNNNRCNTTNHNFFDNYGLSNHTYTTTNNYYYLYSQTSYRPQVQTTTPIKVYQSQHIQSDRQSRTPNYNDSWTSQPYNNQQVHCNTPNYPTSWNSSRSNWSGTHQQTSIGPIPFNQAPHIRPYKPPTVNTYIPSYQNIHTPNIYRPPVTRTW